MTDPLNPIPTQPTTVQSYAIYHREVIRSIDDLTLEELELVAKLSCGMYDIVRFALENARAKA